MSNPNDSLRQLASFGTLESPEIAARLSTGLESFIARWQKETLPFLLSGGAELRFVEGPNGRGKTHFLQTLEVAGLQAGFATARIQCGLQNKPFAAMQETYREIAKTMTAPRNGASRPATGIAGILNTISAHQLTAYQDAPRSNPGFSNLVAAYAKRIQSKPHPDPLTDDLRALLHNDNGRRVLFPDMYLRARREGTNLHRPIGRVGKRNAGVWLRSLLALPKQLGLNGLIVLFDETGSDLHLRPEPFRARQQHLANLRNLIDHLAVGDIRSCSIIYATTHDFIQLARQEYPAISQRIERLESVTPFATRQANPRAVWCRLDELTDPSPSRPQFFVELGEKLIALGREAAIPTARLDFVRRQLPELAQKMSQDLKHAAVREFTKRIAADVLRNPKSHE